MDVFCLGMPRSASTWQYAVTCDLVERHHNGRRMGYVWTTEQVAELNGSEETQAWRVFKSHSPPSPWLAQRISAGQAKSLYSFRDLRDVAFSLMHKLAGTFEQVVEQQRLLTPMIEADEFWQNQDLVLRQRFEAIVCDPVAAVADIAAYLGINLTVEAAVEIAELHSLHANKTRADDFAARLRASGADLSDPAYSMATTEDRMLHWNHIRSASVGGWKADADPRQIAVLAILCGSWLIRRGYESNMAWADRGLEFLNQTRGSESASLSQSNAVPWEVHFARMDIQASVHRLKHLLKAQGADSETIDAFTAAENLYRSQIEGMRESMQDKARELAAAEEEAAHFRSCHDSLCEERDFLLGQLQASEQHVRSNQEALSHFKTCHDALIEERDFLRGQLRAASDELQFLREQRTLLTAERTQLLGDSLALRQELARRAA